MDEIPEGSWLEAFQKFSDAFDELWHSILDELGWLEYPVRFILWCMKKLRL